MVAHPPADPILDSDPHVRRHRLQAQGLERNVQEILKKKGEIPRKPGIVEVSNVGGGYALDASDTLDAGKSIFEFASDVLIVSVDKELCVNLLESEDVVADLGLLNFHTGRDKVGELGRDGGDIGGISVREYLVNGIDLCHSNPSRSDESAFGTFVRNALVAAGGTPSDLDFPAFGALEESVAVADEPLSAGRAYFISSHSRTDMILLYKAKVKPTAPV